MAHDDGEIYWYDPDPRTILPLDAFHIPRRLQQKINRRPYEIFIDRDFRATMIACAAPAPGRETTWIDENILDSYCNLHRFGYAHSVEAWQDDVMVGGLYGVSLGGLFAGESMFSIATDASKICLVNLVQHMVRQGFTLLDVQFTTAHLQRFGAMEIPQIEYKRQLVNALNQAVSF